VGDEGTSFHFAQLSRQIHADLATVAMPRWSRTAPMPHLSKRPRPSSVRISLVDEWYHRRSGVILQLKDRSQGDGKMEVDAVTTLTEFN
jgi:hypothetical protein